MAKDNRQERAERARELFKEHPEWGRHTVNIKLRQEFGKGLGSDFIRSVKKEVIAKAPSIREKSRESWLSSHGFLPSEVKSLKKISPKSLDLQLYTKERAKVLAGVKTESEKRAKIKDWYESQGQAPKGRIRPESAFKDFRAKELPGQPSPVTIKYPRAIADLPFETRVEIRRLRQVGFTEFEIFGGGNRAGLIRASGEEKAFFSEAWEAMIRQREKEVARMAQRGMTRQEIANFYNRQYRWNPQLSPFDLVDETSPQFMPTRKSDYVSARQQRARKLHRLALGMPR